MGGHYAKIIAVGSYLPAKRVSNDDLAKSIETSDEWIRRRTGIEARHIAAAGELTSHLGLEAAKRALAAAKLTPDSLDAIICATTTPDNSFPATATRIQSMLGMGVGIAFDIQAVCAGFIYALAQADNLIRLGQAQHVLVVGAERYSGILDWQDRGTSVLFGDGAGAVILQACPHHAEYPKLSAHSRQSAILDSLLKADGAYYDDLLVDGGPGQGQGLVGKVRMNGQEVYRHAIQKMADVVSQICDRAGITPHDLDWLVPHQANVRIIEQVGERLALPKDKVIITVAEHANTSAATIPLALDRAATRGLLKKGDLVALTALGGGFAWGAVLLRW